MKIALVTDNGEIISQHFGRARFYMVVTVENGQIVNRELREKLGHNHFHNQEHEGHHNGQHAEAGHGSDPASHDRHASMAQAIADCEVLICGGMGAGAYESMRRLNIKPVVTELRDIDQAVMAYLAGSLQDRTDLLH